MSDLLAFFSPGTFGSDSIPCATNAMVKFNVFWSNIRIKFIKRF